MGGTSGVIIGSAASLSHGRRAPGRVASHHSIRTYMVGLIVVVVTPLLAFSAFLVLRSAQHEQEIMASTVRERAQAVSATIDHELSLLRARLFLLAGSKHLQTGDFAAFHARASNAVQEHDLKVVLSDLAGQEIINTGRPFGEALPATLDL